MGHRFSLLRLSPALGAWRRQGLTHVWRPAAQAVSAPAVAEAAPAVPAQAVPDSAVPDPWAQWQGRIRTPCRVVWTYAELAQDYATPSPARRDLWKRLLAAMPWKGVSGFLPAVGPGGHRPFWRVVAALDAPVVLCFGAPALQAIAPGVAFAIGPMELHGRTLLVLPAPDDLLADPAALDAALAVVSSLRPA